MKKALTPLISTLLLLAFAVALGAMVMSWGSVRQSQGCDGVHLGIVDLNGRQLCSKEASVELTLENNGNVAIPRIQAAILSESAASSVSVDVNLSPGEFRRISLEASKVLKIRIIPYAEQACINQRIEVAGIPRC